MERGCGIVGEIKGLGLISDRTDKEQRFEEKVTKVEEILGRDGG